MSHILRLVAECTGQERTGQTQHGLVTQSRGHRPVAAGEVKWLRERIKSLAGSRIRWVLSTPKDPYVTIRKDGPQVKQ